MAHSFTFVVRCTVERTSGKFAARDDIADSIIQELEGIDADVSYLDADGSSEYTFTLDSVEEVSPKALVTGQEEQADPEPESE